MFPKSVDSQTLHGLILHCNGWIHPVARDHNETGGPMSTLHDPLTYAISRAKMAGEHFGKRNECMAFAVAHREHSILCAAWVRSARVHNRLAIKLMGHARAAAADAVSK